MNARSVGEGRGSEETRLRGPTGLLLRLTCSPNGVPHRPLQWVGGSSAAPRRPDWCAPGAARLLPSGPGRCDLWRIARIGTPCRGPRWAHRLGHRATLPNRRRCSPLPGVPKGGAPGGGKWGESAHVTASEDDISLDLDLSALRRAKREAPQGPPTIHNPDMHPRPPAGPTKGRQRHTAHPCRGVGRGRREQKP